MKLTYFIPAPEAAKLKEAGGDPLDPVILSFAPLNQKERIEELEKANGRLEERVHELELALGEARRIIRDREQLLSQVQWLPKDDYYVWKNPKISGKFVKDELEERLKALMDQMRVMEKVLEEREQEIEDLHEVIREKETEKNSKDKRLTSSDSSPLGSPAIRHDSRRATSPSIIYPHQGIIKKRKDGGG